MSVTRFPATPTTVLPSLNVLGNTDLDGTLNVDGAATLQSTLNVIGNLAVNTSKLTVAAASGDLTTAGNIACLSGGIAANLGGVQGSTVTALTSMITPALTVSNHAPGIAHTFPSCRAERQAVQTLTTGVWTAISLDTETWDTDAYFAPTSKTMTLPAGYGGLYLVTISALFVNNLTGFRGVALSLNDSTDTANGVVFDGMNQTNAAGGSTFRAGPYAGLVRLSAGDTLTLKAIQTSGGNLDVDNVSAGRSYGTALEIIRIGS
jgi:hypothetical protein